MQRFVQSKDVAWNHLGENIIAFNLSGEREFHNLNETAAVIFAELAEPRTREELVSKLTQEFDVEEAAASQDLSELLQELHTKRLIEEA